MRGASGTERGASTGAGKGRADVMVPSPSCPWSFDPQHSTPLPVVSAQVWEPPAEIAATPLSSPATSTGVRRCVVELSPSWPNALYPQHLAPPAVVSAQVWCPPGEIAPTPLESPVTSAG